MTYANPDNPNWYYEYVQSTIDRPYLADALDQLGPLPLEALFLGIASDTVPVLHNLFDPHPGPVLISADQGGGKTEFLQAVAASAGLTHRPESLQFGVVTASPQEWVRFENIANNVGIFDFTTNAGEIITSLARWAHDNRDNNQQVLLLIDGLEYIDYLDSDVQQNLRWLLLRGPARHAWPLVSLNPQYRGSASIAPWLEAFRTRIFGHMDDQDIGNELGAYGARLSEQPSGSHYAIMEDLEWVHFWQPKLFA